MLEITESKIECKMFGDVVNLHAPSALNAAKFYEELKPLKSELDQVKKSIEFLVSCGMKQETAERLELHQLQKVIELIATKKN